MAIVTPAKEFAGRLVRKRNAEFESLPTHSNSANPEAEQGRTRREDLYLALCLDLRVDDNIRVPNLSDAKARPSNEHAQAADGGHITKRRHREHFGQRPN